MQPTYFQRPSMRMSMVRLLSRHLLWVLPFLLFGQVAFAASDLNATKRTAKTACLTGDYAKGVALLAELYVDTNDPMHIFNQGRCFEQNGRYEDAINRFREYQRKLTDANSAPDPEAERHINDCQALIETKKPPAPYPMPADTGPTAPVANPQPSTGATSPANGSSGVPMPVGPTPSQEKPPMPVQKKLGYAAGVLGILGIAVGVYTFSNAQDHLDKSRALGCTDSNCVGPAKDEYNAAQSNITVSNITAISGGVLLLGGLIMVLTAPSPTATPRTVALVPIVGPGSAQLAFAGRF
jgi:hypothetical protein